MDLIRCRQWGLAATLPVDEALKPNFAATLIRYFQDRRARGGCAQYPHCRSAGAEEESALRAEIERLRAVFCAGASAPGSRRSCRAK